MMADPTWFSHDQPQMIDDPITKTVLMKPGNWAQGQGGERLVEARYIHSWSIDNKVTWSAPARDATQYRNPTTGLFDPLPGEGQSTYSYASLTPGTWRIWGQVSAGTHSVYYTQDGQLAYDAYEWGVGNVNDPSLPLQSYVDVVIPEIVVPPDPVPTIPFDVVRLDGIRKATLEEERQAKATYQQWRTQNPGEAKKYDDYVAAVSDGQRPIPPSLTTHRGRAVVGKEQMGALVLGRLP